MARPRRTSSSTIRSFGRAGWSSSTRCATGSTGAPADRRGRPAAGLYRSPVRHVLDAPAEPEQVLKLREDHAIYMADSGRFNVVGMGDEQIDRFIAAVVEALDG